jgi:hypothetical protein
MLDKISSFNSLVDRILLSEGYFNVPEKVISEIKKDFKDVLRFKDEELEKNYKLDFSDTPYDFLNELDPQPSIDVKFKKGRGKGKGSFHFTSDERLERNNSFIQIDLLDNPERILYNVIEHEVSHFIQKMIKKYNEEKKGYGSLGGMPSKKLLKGIEFDKSKIKKHSHIPSEIYPDLLSVIRELQFFFDKENQDKSLDNKKRFFIKFIKSLDSKKSIGETAPEIFRHFKELPKPLYKDILKKAYSAFVND